MVRTPVQPNHMCDCPNRLHIDVVGTAYPISAIYAARKRKKREKEEEEWEGGGGG